MDERGEMITAIFRYSSENVIPDFDSRSMSVIFKRFKDTLDRDRVKWDNKCKVNRENGKKGGRPKTQNNPTKPNGFSENPTKPKKPDICNMINDICNMSSENNKETSSCKPLRHKYGKYKNVLLSDQELEDLKSEFPNNWSEWIEKVSEYCSSHGKTYKNYLATIRNWAKKSKSNVNSTPKSSTKGKSSKYSNYKPIEFTEEEYLEIEKEFNIQ